MQLKSQNAFLREEEQHKELVYRHLDAMTEQAGSDMNHQQQYVLSDAFEDQDAFAAYSDFHRASVKKQSAEQQRRILYKNPYFAHMELRDCDAGGANHVYLSGCDALQEAVPIGASGNMLFPFKKDKRRPISGALISCYYNRNGKPVSYPVQTRDGEKCYTIQPLQICDDEIDSRRLLSATQLFPNTIAPTHSADELLDARLEENRSNPAFRNIIATLQQKQFQIIEADTKADFVVQGCAGSGKSQCLLHRLFYLRDELSQDSWKHVLLITPTQLFRRYSSELFRRYKLSDIQNCSLAELYKFVLSAFDSRFKNRQYIFELTEEYLPDRYLQEVYAPTTIQSIAREIDRAVSQYVRTACAALGIDTPDVIDAGTITELVKQLDAELTAFASREAILSQDTTYEERRSQFEQRQKELAAAQKSLSRLNAEQEELNRRIEVLDRLQAELQEAKDEIAKTVQQQNEQCVAARQALKEIENNLQGRFSPELPAKYAHQLFILHDLTAGAAYAATEEYLQFLKEVLADAEGNLQSFTNGQSTKRTETQLQRRNAELQSKIAAVQKEISALSSQLESDMSWLEEKARTLEGEKSRIVLQRTEMDRSRYFLSRIESTIFEQAVWNALLPYKKQNDIKAVDVEQLENGHRRETRILYKSDLLFYIMVYTRLHPNETLSNYHMLCIDEGQDLHKADYDLLHKLFPNAAFNIFGDLSQVLHTACGVHDWEADTGIPTVYKLRCNYRNNAALVQFCNARFGSGMEAIGKVRPEQSPVVLHSRRDLRDAVRRRSITMIVKDRQAFSQFCQDVELSEDTFEYLDTKARKSSDNKPNCYSIFAAKGLEFTNVVVYAKEMTVNQKIVACTRAMKELYYYE